MAGRVVMLPIRDRETSQLALCVVQVLLNLFAHVKNRTIPAGAQHGLVQRALALLALRPDARKLLLEIRSHLQSLLVDQHLHRLAVLAEVCFYSTRQTVSARPTTAAAAIRCTHTSFAQNRVAAHASQLLDCEFGNASGRTGLHGNRARMLARDELVGIGHDRLKDVHQRVLDLMLEVVLGVDWNVVLQYVQRILGTLVGLGVLGTLDNHVRHTITNVRCCSSIAKSHSFSELDMCLLDGVVSTRQGYVQ
jgi:hypothetical protein